MSPLFTQTCGNGPVLFMVHGWAMHGGIFDAVGKALAKHFTVIRVDLPGHGRSAPLPAGDDADDILATWMEALLAAAPDKALWLGWSLGGRLASHVAARHPDRVEKLILIASNPQFVRDDSWPHGMDPVYFKAFAQSVHSDYRKTLLRFLSLQTRGSDHSREDLRRLKDTVFAHGEPDSASVFQGLELLKSLKIGGQLEKIHCPTLVMLGERDTLVPKEAGDEIFERLGNPRLMVLKGAGHAPFLSHQEDVCEAVRAFGLNHHS